MFHKHPKVDRNAGTCAQKYPSKMFQKHSEVSQSTMPVHKNSQQDVSETFQSEPDSRACAQN